MSRTFKIVLYSVFTAILIVILVIGVNANMFPFIYYPIGQAGIKEAALIQAAPNEVASIEADLASEDVNLKTAETDKITVKCYSNMSINPNEYLKIDLSGGTLRINRFDYIKSFFPIKTAPKITCEIIVPQNMEFDSVDIGCASGTIEIKDIVAGHLSAETSSGEILIGGCAGSSANYSSSSGFIQADDISFDALEANAASGDIRISGDVSGEAEIGTASGDISFKGNVSNLSAGASSGDINAEIAGVKSADLSAASGLINCVIANSTDLKDITADTTSGDVKIKLPENTPYNPDITTMSGDVRTEGIVKGAGAALEVQISTASGNVWIGY